MVIQECVFCRVLLISFGRNRNSISGYRVFYGAGGMNIRTKFNLVLFFTFLLGLIALSFYYKHFVTEVMVNAVKNESKLHMQAAIAIRSYTANHIKPLLDIMPAEEFLPQRIPAYSARETMDILYKNYADFRYREAALNPTNIKDLAAGWEVDIIDRYRAGKIENEHIEMTDKNGRVFINVTHPIRVSDKSCLACHGVPSQAPVSMINKYGSHHGFGWKIGEIIGAQIVSLPLDAALAQARFVYDKFIFSMIGVFLLLFIALNILLGRVVILPLHKDNMHLSVLASKDPLTGLLNRRSFDEVFSKELILANERAAALSLIMFDLDHFKKVNDTFGHDKGDLVLKMVSELIKLNIKNQDYLVRLGGEEFAILLPNTHSVAACLFANSLRLLVMNQKIPDVGHVTASFGVAMWKVSDQDLSAFMDRADKALYAAKNGGRNQVALAE